MTPEKRYFCFHCGKELTGEKLRIRLNSRAKGGSKKLFCDHQCMGLYQSAKLFRRRPDADMLPH